MPNYIEALNNYAQNLRLNIENYSEAIIYYTKAIDINPKYEYCLFQRSICKGALKDYKGQIEDLSKIIELEPNETDLYISRAIVRKNINDYKGIIEDCTYVISLTDENSSAFQYRGEAQISLSNFNEGIIDLEKAIEIEERKSKEISWYTPLSFNSLKMSGSAKLLINNFLGALDSFEKLVAIYPNNPQSYKLRAQANEKIGNLESYKRDMEIFQKLNTEHFEKYGVSF